MTYGEIWRRLAAIYDSEEAKAVARMVLDVGFGLSMTDICCGATEHLDGKETARLEEMLRRLEKAEPVQYVLGTAFFCGRNFRVRPGVLIPRPETEELCAWITGDHRGESGRKSILDIGTGSGCIAITLALDMPAADVTAWEISPAAADVARDNARQLGAQADIRIQDALCPPDNGEWDIIVSNPPYIYNSEREDMERNVVEYEPHTALFVPDDNPLLFYDAIAGYAIRTLRDGGMLYFEINPKCAGDMTRMLGGKGFRDIVCRDDMFGKKRMIRATKKVKQ